MSSEAEGADMSEQPTATAADDAAWIEKTMPEWMDEAHDDFKHALAVAGRMREYGEDMLILDKPDHVADAGKMVPMPLELGPATLAALRQGFAMVAGAVFPEEGDAEWFAKRARTLAAAMTPGEGETTSAKDLRAFNDVLRKNRELQQRLAAAMTPGEGVLDRGNDNQRDGRSVRQQYEQRIQELEAENEKYSAGMQENCSLRQRLTAATKLLCDCQQHFDWCDKQPSDTPDIVVLQERINAWLKGQPEAATPPFNAEKVAERCVDAVFGEDPQDGDFVTPPVLHNIIADEIRKEQGDE